MNSGHGLFLGFFLVISTGCDSAPVVEDVPAAARLQVQFDVRGCVTTRGEFLPVEGGVADILVLSGENLLEVQGAQLPWTGKLEARSDRYLHALASSERGTPAARCMIGRLIVAGDTVRTIHNQTFGQVLDIVLHLSPLQLSRVLEQ